MGTNLNSNGNGAGNGIPPELFQMQQLLIEASPGSKFGEVSPYKILIAILLREYYTHFDLRPASPKGRISIGYFFHRLITNEDISYKKLMLLCKEHRKILPSEVFISFLRTVENADEGNPCFLNELVSSIMDLVDSAQTIILRKKIAKGSPLGRFLRRVMLTLRVMSFAQISTLYREFWKFIKDGSTRRFRRIVIGKSPHLLGKSFNKLYAQQHPPLTKNSTKPGLDSFHQMMISRANIGKRGLGTTLRNLPNSTSSHTKGSNSSCIVSTSSNKAWNSIRWHSRKLIERTVRIICSEIFTIGTKRYTPQQISKFVEAIQYNISSQGVLPQLHFMEYLNCVQLKDISRCADSLRKAFDLRVNCTSTELTKGTPYAAYNFALYYDFLGFRHDSLTLLEEAFQSAHLWCDQLCLHFCNNLWATIHRIPYKGVIHQNIKEMDKTLSYLHSFNVAQASFELQLKGKSSFQILQNVWKCRTGFDFEYTESLLLNSLSNYYSIFGDPECAGIAAELVLTSSNQIKWPIKNYFNSLIQFAYSILLSGNFELADTLVNKFGKEVVCYRGSIASDQFMKAYFIFQAVKRSLSRKPIDQSVLQSIRAYDHLEHLLWDTYNCLVTKEWEICDAKISRIWESLKVKSIENSEIAIRTLLIEAELLCSTGSPKEALKPLFEALDLSTRLSADYYISTCQISICKIQMFLGLWSLGVRTLHLNTLSKCRNASKLLRAKLSVATAKLLLHIGISSTKDFHGNEMIDDLQKICTIFQDTSEPDENDQTKPSSPRKQPNRRSTRVQLTHSEGSSQSTESMEHDSSLLILTKIKLLLNFASKIFTEFENVYLLGEVFSLQLELPHSTEAEKENIMKEFDGLNCECLEYYRENCIL